MPEAQPVSAGGTVVFSLGRQSQVNNSPDTFSREATMGMLGQNRRLIPASLRDFIAAFAIRTWD